MEKILGLTGRGYKGQPPLTTKILWHSREEHSFIKIKKWFLNALKLKFDLILICEKFFVSINTIFWSNLGLPFSIPWKHYFTRIVKTHQILSHL